MSTLEMKAEKIFVDVEINGATVKVGTLFAHQRRGKESMTFAYDEGYISNPSAYALEPALPLTLGAHQTPVGKSIFGCFSDSSPDRWGRRIIERREAARALAAKTPAHSMSEIEILLMVRDDVRQGALRFSFDGVSHLADKKQGVPALIALPKLLALAHRIDGEQGTYAEFEEIFLGGGSLGGARPKVHVLDDRGNLSIAKFSRPGNDEWDVMGWEKTLLDLAKKAGISVPQSTLVPVGTERVLLLKRFDRNVDKRVGYVSAMTMLDKKDGDEGSYLDIAEIIERYSLEAGKELEELWRRIVFSVLTSNRDDHLRNHGFLKKTGDSWTLSPAFDLNPDPNPSRFQKTAISEKDTTASIALCFEVIDYFRIDNERARKILTEVLSAVSCWKEIAQSNGISVSDINRMKPAFENQEHANALSNF
jgi:serine/threonine-protein kinase HipA